MSYQECHHVLASGETCRAPRVKNERYCYFHVSARDRVRRQRLAAQRKLPVQVPVLEDAMTIQLALGDVINAMLADRIDMRKAALTLYALQTASANLKNLPRAVQTYKEYTPELSTCVPETEPVEPETEASAPAEQSPARIPHKKPVQKVEAQRQSFSLRELLADFNKHSKRKKHRKERREAAKAAAQAAQQAANGGTLPSDTLPPAKPVASASAESWRDDRDEHGEDAI